MQMVYFSALFFDTLYSLCYTKTVYLELNKR